MTLYSKKICKFIEEEWDDTFAYTPSDIAEILDCDPRLARYYLLKMIERGILCQLKYRRRTYYIKPEQSKQFERFGSIGLTILVR
jgi:hypothetical protein